MGDIISKKGINVATDGNGNYLMDSENKGVLELNTAGKSGEAYWKGEECMYFVPQRYSQDDERQLNKILDTEFFDNYGVEATHRSISNNFHSNIKENENIVKTQCYRLPSGETKMITNYYIFTDHGWIEVPKV